MATDRIYQGEDGDWFFLRRGEDAGPFPSYDHAEIALDRFVRTKHARVTGKLPSWRSVKRVVLRRASPIAA